MSFRGQGSAEYLIVLAVVLIVALVAIVLIGGFPGFGSDAQRTESAQYWSGSARPIAIAEQAQINSTVYITVLNVETTRLILRNATLADRTANYSNSTIPAVGLTLGSGARKTIAISGLIPCNAASFDEYEYTVTFIYDTTDITGKTERGNKPIVGKCVIG